MTKFKIKETYLLMLIVVGLVSLGIYTTYAMFTASTTLNDVVGITTTLDVGKGLTEYQVVTVGSGETKLIELNIVNSYSSSIYYGAWYQIVQGNSSDIDIGLYTEKNSNPSSGSLATNGSINLLAGVTNNGTSSITVYIGAKGSLTNELTLGNNKILIQDGFVERLLVTSKVLEMHKTQKNKNINLEFTNPESNSIILLPGTYKFEAWGAQGGGSSGEIRGHLSGHYTIFETGGKGGYSYGSITLDDTTEAFVYVGGVGKDDKLINDGGFNGGGASRTISESTKSYNETIRASSGGGASDIRLISDSLFSRVIVAGGGGGGFYHFSETIRNEISSRPTSSTSFENHYGGEGGGENGIDGIGVLSSSSSHDSEYATQGFGHGGSNITFGTSTYCIKGSFFTKDTYVDNSTDYGILASFGIGGGSSSSKNYAINGGGGGSGWVYTLNNFNTWKKGNSVDASNWLLDNKYYLTDAATINGKNSFVDFSGATVTGHSGNGAVRISGTAIETIYTIPNLTGLTDLNISQGEKVNLIDGTVLTCENNSVSGCSIKETSITDTSTLTKGTHIITYDVLGSDNKIYSFRRNVEVK